MPRLWNVGTFFVSETSDSAGLRGPRLIAERSQEQILLLAASVPGKKRRGVEGSRVEGSRGRGVGSSRIILQRIYRAGKFKERVDETVATFPQIVRGGYSKPRCSIAC